MKRMGVMFVLLTGVSGNYACTKISDDFCYSRLKLLSKRLTNRKTFIEPPIICWPVQEMMSQLNPVASHVKRFLVQYQ